MYVAPTVCPPETCKIKIGSTAKEVSKDVIVKLANTFCLAIVFLSTYYNILAPALTFLIFLT
jgi:hypothetical protein